MAEETVKHDYNWKSESLGSDRYKVTWYDHETELVSTECCIKGSEEEVAKALYFAAQELKKANPLLFPADEEGYAEELAETTTTEQEVAE